MNVKFVLSAVALLAALAIGSPAFAQDNTMPKSKPHAAHHHAAHHTMVHKAAVKPMAKPMHRAAPHAHGMMGADAKERAETAKLNQEQLVHPGM
jgi:hypothetical protein